MFNIANTLHPNVVKELIEYAHTQRFDVKEDKQHQAESLEQKQNQRSEVAITKICFQGITA